MKLSTGIFICLQFAILSQLKSQTTGTCDPTTACRSIVVDTSCNPYITGALGNWRSNRSYTFFTRRAESDPSVATNIRTNGTFNDFNTFWNFQGKGLQPQYDTTRWVWNSEITLFNRKGLEIENKDPLGRYNAGLYGYNVSLPVAVIQNARYRECAFEGFEDYGYTTQVCDTLCATGRHIDYSAYANKFDTLQKHTGKSSLKLMGGEQVGLSFTIGNASADTATARFSFNRLADTCKTIGSTLASIKTTSNILLPVFSPYKGKNMVISVWVKEEKECNCTSYSKNQVLIGINGTTTYTLVPTGSIIEGWQRYENVFLIPDNATTMVISLKSTGNATDATYFDDLRIHPFNSNMKSFVYHPVNLRLMAELDENNYATLYEYDDDGTLVRVKKETIRGVKTIKETRSALVKEQ